MSLVVLKLNHFIFYFFMIYQFANTILSYFGLMAHVNCSPYAC